MDPRSSFSKSNSARGRIAQVLAQARASLNEPTRPVTPQLLDQRTAMPFALDAIPQGKISVKTKKRSDKSKRDEENYQYSMNFSESTQFEKDSTRRHNSMPNNDVLDSFAPNTDEIDSVHILENKKREKASWTLSKVINDFVVDLKAGVDAKFEETLLAIEESTKRLKSSSVDVSVSRLQTTQACLSELIHYINCYVNQAPWIFQLNSAILRFLVTAASLEEHSDTVRSMTLQNMEKMGEFILKSKANPSTGAKNYASVEEMDVSVMSTADQADTVILLPVLVDCLQFLMARLNMSFSALSKTIRAGKAIEIVNDSAICCLLNSASYCMATIRALSTNHETDRKRLLHANGLEVITQMITFYDVYSKVVMNIHVNSVSTSAFGDKSGSNRDDDGDQDEDDDALQSIPISPLVQVIGVLRNISLDKSGRTQIVDTTLCRTLCVFLKTYSNYAEVVINIARVLAKLSLYETFRSQISNGPRENRHEYVSCLVSVLKKESDLCLKIMEDEKHLDENDEYNGNDWPSWYTWPLISRMAFTLGNFTTTNETNRSLIGTTLGGSESILLLFQVSVSTLMRIQEVKKQKEEAKAVVTNNVFSFAKGLLGGGNPYESLDGPKPSDEPVVEEDEAVDSASELELRDAIIKLVRLIANLSIDYDVGIQMGSDRENLQSLLDLLSICDSSFEHEEMMLNVIAALTNLTFYSCQFIDLKISEDDTAETGIATASNTATHKFVARLDRTLIAIAQRVADGLFHENTEIVLETARVFGNLTRRSSVVQLLFRKRIDEALLMLLAHINTEVISAVAGVFVNISAYAEGRMLLLQREDPYFVPHVSAMLRRLTLKDIPIAILLTQILYNVITSTDYEQAVKTNKEHRVPPNLFGTLEEWIELVEDAVDQQQHIDESKQAESSSRRKQQSREMQYNAQFIQVAKALSEHIATMGAVSL